MVYNFDAQKIDAFNDFTTQLFYLYVQFNLSNFSCQFSQSCITFCCKNLVTEIYSYVRTYVTTHSPMPPYRRTPYRGVK